MVLDAPEGTRSLFSPSTRYAQIRRVIAQRLQLVRPFRQRALRVPLGLHHPVWVDDPDFELDDHLSRASLPTPGGRAELDAFVAGAMSRPLDPDRPLWEMYVVEGLAGGRTALIAKVHHAILDGVSGASTLAAFLDLNPRERVVALPDGTWDPEPMPGGVRMLRYAASRHFASSGSGVERHQRRRGCRGGSGHAQPRAAEPCAVATTGLLLRTADIPQRHRLQSQAVLVSVDLRSTTPSSSVAPSGAR